MKKFLSATMMLGFCATLATASPNYPADLRWDCKSQFIPLQHQSGWGYCTEIQAPIKKAAAPKQTPQAKVVPQNEWILKGVNFETNSDRLQTSSMVVLNDAADVLKENPNVKVEIQGHTDNMGDDTFNQELSQRRADAVKVYLIDKGISSGRLSAKGYGESKPIASNETADGRSSNRRIEFKVTER